MAQLMGTEVVTFLAGGPEVEGLSKMVHACGYFSGWELDELRWVAQELRLKFSSLQHAP